MGRIDEGHVTLAGDGGVQTRPQIVIEESRLSLGVLGQVLLGGTGIMWTLWNFRPMSLRNSRTWLGPRRNPVSRKMRSQASATVRTGCSSKDLRIRSRLGGHLALVTMDVPAPQAIPAPFSKGDDVAIDGGTADADDLGGFLAGEAAMEEPGDPHPVTDSRVGMGDPLLVNDALFVLGQLYAKPGHDVPRYAASGSGRPPCILTRVIQSFTPGNISLCAASSIDRSFEVADSEGGALSFTSNPHKYQSIHTDGEVMREGKNHY